VSGFARLDETHPSGMPRAPAVIDRSQFLAQWWDVTSGADLGYLLGVDGGSCFIGGSDFIGGRSKC